MLILTVVNRMLATLGEAPLNALTDPHTFKTAAVTRLDTRNTAVQAAGWWFNTERLTLTPSVADGRLYLPGDVTNVKVPNRRDIVQRGRLLYDTVNGTNVFTEDVKTLVVRKVNFDELPDIVAEYIAALAVLEFQTDFDGDSNKMKVLQGVAREATMNFNSEVTLQAQYNMLDSNTSLQRLKSRINQARKR